jgi:hypothetical protein
VTTAGMLFSRFSACPMSFLFSACPMSFSLLRPKCHGMKPNDPEHLRWYEAGYFRHASLGTGAGGGATRPGVVKGT